MQKQKYRIKNNPLPPKSVWEAKTCKAEGKAYKPPMHPRKERRQGKERRTIFRFGDSRSTYKSADRRSYSQGTDRRCPH